MPGFAPRAEKFFAATSRYFREDDQCTTRARDLGDQPKGICREADRHLSGIVNPHDRFWAGEFSGVAVKPRPGADGRAFHPGNAEAALRSRPGMLMLIGRISN
jgi:hypothetical protein